MQVLKEAPPVAQQIKDTFGIDYDDGNIIVTYGEDIHTKSGNITNELLAHEMTHIMQQRKVGVIIWWANFFNNREFRLQQEIEAYRNQYRYIIDNVKDRNQRFKHLVGMSRALSGPIYGNMIGCQDALKLIKQT